MKKTPTDNEIWSVLNQNSNAETAENVSRWFACEEGQTWLINHSEEIMNNIEHENSENDTTDIPSFDMLKNIHDQIRINEDTLSRERKIRNILFNIAAVCIPGLICIAVWFDTSRKVGIRLPFAKCEMLEVTTKPGETKSILFQDGTQVMINSGATITFPKTWRISERNLQLTGEAFFDVAKMKRRPLVVDVDNYKIKVYGTKFNVKSYPESENIEIILVDGNIVFEANNSDYELKPLQKLLYNKESQSISLEKVQNINKEICWKDNYISFRNSSLKEVISDISRIYGVSFNYDNELLNDYSFTIKTEKGKLENLLEELSYISGLTFHECGGVVTITK